MALNEQIAANVGPSGIEIAYERRGNPADPIVLLIMGGAAQLVQWPDGFLAALLCRRCVAGGGGARGSKRHAVSGGCAARDRHHRRVGT